MSTGGERLNSVAPITMAEIEAAAATIAEVATETPVLTSRELDRLTGVSVLAKAEGRQRAGSFKFRGAYNRIASIPSQDRAAGVVAVSSGNHGAAVACAAHLLSMPATVFIPHDAPAAKRSLIEEFGAEVVTFDRATEDREQLARDRARSSGATFVHPFEDRRIMAGQGTAALELHHQVGPLDILLVPMSGGGLMAGCASVMAELDPTCRMIGVEPTLGDDTRRSFEVGRPVTIAQPATMADGLAVVSPGPTTFAINQRLVERVVTVDEDQIAAAMVVLRDTLDLVVEPSGAVGVAALLNDRVPLDPSGRPSSQPDRPDRQAPRVGVILSGGNIDRERFVALTGQV